MTEISEDNRFEWDSDKNKKNKVKHGLRFEQILPIFDDPFFGGHDGFMRREENRIMKTDIKEKKDKYVIEIDLPGYEKENINLELKEGYLNVVAKVQKEETKIAIKSAVAKALGKEVSVKYDNL